MRLLLDTNRYVDLVNKDPEVERLIRTATEICVPLIVLGELRAGFANGRKQRSNEARLQRFLAKPGVQVLTLDEETTEYYAEIFRRLRRAGSLIPTNDIWIAAQALQHSLYLYSRDKHFKDIPKLKMAN